jgi:hypothetical protein
MGIKISGYTQSTGNPDDNSLLDISEFNGVAYFTRKIRLGDLKTLVNPPVSEIMYTFSGFSYASCSVSQFKDTLNTGTPNFTIIADGIFRFNYVGLDPSIGSHFLTITAINKPTIIGATYEVLFTNIDYIEIRTYNSSGVLANDLYKEICLHYIKF